MKSEFEKTEEYVNIFAIMEESRLTKIFLSI
jgi:hypothetical protein